MNFLKKTTLSLIMTFLLVMSCNVKAFTGLLSNDSNLVIFGAALTNLSQITYIERDVHYSYHRRFAVYTYRTVTYIPMALFGLLVLDEDGDAELKKLDNKTAEKLNINDNELKKFNNELEQINLIVTSISEELNPDSSREEKLTQTVQLWNEYSDYLSEDAFSAVVKISLQLQK